MALTLQPTHARTRAQGRGLSASARGVDVGLSAVARGVGEVGRAAEAVVRAKQKRQAERDRIWRATTLAEGGARWAETAAERERGAELGAPGHAAGLEADFDAWQEETLASAPASQKKALEARPDPAALKPDAEGRRVRDREPDGGADDRAERGRRHDRPRRLRRRHRPRRGAGAGRERSSNDLDASAATKAELGAELRGGLTRSHYEGLIERDPLKAEKDLLEGRADLDADTQATLMRSAKVAQRRIEAERRQAEAEAERAAREKQAVARGELGVKLDNDLALARDGHKVPKRTLADFTSAYGENAPEAFEAYVAGIEQMTTLSGMTFASNADNRAAVLAAEPDPSSPNYKAEAETFRALQEQEARVRKARQADPAAFVVQTNPAVGEAFAAAAATEDPEEQARAMMGAQRGLLDAQARLGIPEADRRAWSKGDVAKRTDGDPGRGGPAQARRRVDPVSSTSPRRRGRRATNLLKDMEAWPGCPRTSRFLLAAIEAGDVRGVSVAFGALQAPAKPDKEGKDALDQAVLDDPIGAASRLEALHTGDARTLEERDGLERAARSLADFYVATDGMEAKAAWAKAKATYAAGRGEVAEAGLAAVSVPAEFDAGTVRLGLLRERERIVGGLDAGGVKAAVMKQFGYTSEQAETMTAGVLADLAETGVWLNVAPGAYKLSVETEEGRFFLPEIVPAAIAQIQGLRQPDGPNAGQQGRRGGAANADDTPWFGKGGLIGGKGSGATVEVGVGEALMPAIDAVGNVLDTAKQELGEAIFGEGKPMTAAERRAARRGDDR